MPNIYLTDNSEHLALLWQQRISAFRREAFEAERESAQEAKRLAEHYSSGPYSQATLTRMGHPYARRAPSPPLPPYFMNRQSGQFFSGWRWYLLVSGDTISSGIWNHSEHGKFLEWGTRLMIERPILEQVEKEMQPKRFARLLAAKRRAEARK